MKVSQQECSKAAWGARGGDIARRATISMAGLWRRMTTSGLPLLRQQKSLPCSTRHRRIERGDGALALFLDGPGRRPPVERIRQPFQNRVPPRAHARAPARARAEAAMGEGELAALAVRRELEQDRGVQPVDHP